MTSISTPNKSLEGVIHQIVLASVDPNRTVKFTLFNRPNAEFEFVSDKVKGHILRILKGTENDWNYLALLSDELKAQKVTVSHLHAHEYTTKKGKIENFVRSEGFNLPSKSSQTQQSKDVPRIATMTSYPSQYDLEERLPKIEDQRNKIFVNPYLVDENEVHLHANTCTFKSLLHVRRGVLLNNCNVVGEVLCKQGSVIAKDSRLAKVKGDTIQFTDVSATNIIAEKGTLVWRNKNKVNVPIELIQAQKEIELENVSRIRKVDSLKESVKAIECVIDTICAVGSVKLINTNVEKVCLIVPLYSKCIVDLTNSEVNELVIEDLESNILMSKQAPHSITKDPNTFNFPMGRNNNSSIGHSQGAFGRIRGIPYKYENGSYLEGVDILILGPRPKKITIKNCIGYIV